jgi:hypothetical protein
VIGVIGTAVAALNRGGDSAFVFQEENLERGHTRCAGAFRPIRA